MSSRIAKAKDVDFDMFHRMAKGAGLDAIEFSEDTWILTGGVEPIEYHKTSGIPPVKAIRKALGKRLQTGKLSKRAKRHRDLLFRSHPYCHWCNKKLTKNTRTLEHLVPLSMGGTDALINLRLACPECNSGRNLSVQRVPKRLLKYCQRNNSLPTEQEPSNEPVVKRERPTRGGLET